MWDALTQKVGSKIIVLLKKYIEPEIQKIFPTIENHDPII